MAGLIPQSFIDDLLSRADIVDVVDSRVSLKKTGKNYSGLCPFHQEKTPSFSVEPDKQFYYCFGCGAGGNAIGFIMNYESLDFPQAIESLASAMGIDVPREESAQAQKTREKNQALYDMLAKAAGFYQAQLRQHPQKDRAISYLKKRNLTGEIARDFGLGYAPPGWQNLLTALGPNADSKALLLHGGMLIEKPENKKNPVYDRFRDRIMYPIKDRRGRIIAFGGRVLGDDNPKYLNSPETPVFHKGEELYGLYEARQKVKKLERILIVEGYMDIIALAQNGIHYCVATLGTATSSSHLRRLFKLVPEVVFCFDGDKAGKDAAWRALQQAMPLLEDGLSAKFLFLPDGEDPDSQVRKIGPQEFISSIQKATQLAAFFFDKLSAQVDLNSLEGKAKLGTLAMPHIRQLPQGIFSQLILDQLAQITGVSRQTLDALEGTQISSPPTQPTKRQAPDSDLPPPPAPYTDSEPYFIPDESEFESTYSDTPRSNSAPPPRAKSPGLSICMKIVNLVILQPSVVSLLDESNTLAQLKCEDIELLQTVIALAQAHPTSTTVELMGRLYALPMGTHLIQLLDREQIIPKEGINKEFQASTNRLFNDHRRQQQQADILEQARQKLQARRQPDENKH